MEFSYVLSFISVTCILAMGQIDTLLEMEDILNERFMPTSLLLVEDEWDSTTGKALFREHKQKAVGYNGSWHDAYVTMGFHRKMLNEYLCRNYLAEEIISEIEGPLISRRSGRPFSKPVSNATSPYQRQSRNEKNNVKESLLSDPGSSNYRNWLSKTTTLEDIYRHYDRDHFSMRDDLEEFDGGEITGYAMQEPENDQMYPPYGYPSMTTQQEQVDQEKHGGEYDYTPHHVHFHGGGEEEKSHHMQLNDVFDVALTALAFLSFGMFILQVIMCITSNKPMQMMQMTGGAPGPTGGATAPGGTGPEDIDGLRFKRDLEENIFSIDELSRKVLTSIEAGMVANKDNGYCLKKVLCENNKYSRTREDGQRLWIPVWGLGMSWLSSKLIEDKASSVVMLDSLKACAFGLAQSDCSVLYPSCNLRHLLNSTRNSTSSHFPASQKGNAKMKGDAG